MSSNSRRVIIFVIAFAFAIPLFAQNDVWTLPSKDDTDAVKQSYRLLRGGTSAGEIQQSLQVLTEQRRALESERAYIISKVEWAKQQMENAGNAKEIQDWQDELKSWQKRQALIEEEVSRIRQEEESLIAAMQESARNMAQNDVVIPGETLDIYVAEDSSLNGVYQVRRGGYIILPRMPRIFVAGKTVVEVEKAIQQELQKTQLRKATVMAERSWAKNNMPDITGRDILYLSGQVSRSGPWPIPDNFKPTLVTTLLRIGLKPYADLSRVRLLRLVDGKGLVEEVNVEKIMEGEGLTADIALQPDDIVIVPAQGSGETQRRIVYIRGSVGRPSVQYISPTETMTPYQAILLSGGANESADLENVELVRVDGDTTSRRYLNLNRILTGQQPDIVLKHQDILIVPAKRESLRVYLTGNIKQAGIMQIPPYEEDLTLYAAIVQRGGFARFANLKKTYVLRDLGDGVRTRIPVNLKAVQKGLVPDLVLEDNDIVVIPEKFFSF